MPLGFFGTAVALVVIAIAIPLLYASVWPGGVSRVALFLSIMTVSGAISGVIAFMWLIAPLANVGIAAAPSGSSSDGTSLNAMLLSRLYIGVVALLTVQAALSKGLQHLLAR